MKKNIIFLTVTCAILLSLSACNPEKPTAPDSDVTSITTSTVSTAAETTTTPAEEELKLNQDLISDYGLNYAEIKEKRGGLIDVFTAGGGVVYVFEDGYGDYGWSEIEIADWENAYLIQSNKHEDKNLEDMPLPKPTAPCKYISDVDVEKLFVGIELPATISDIKKLSELKYSGFEIGGLSGNYTAVFSYEDDIKIVIGTNHVTKDKGDDIVEDDILIDKDAHITLFDNNKDN